MLALCPCRVVAGRPVRAALSDAARLCVFVWPLSVSLVGLGCGTRRVSGRRTVASAARVRVGAYIIVLLSY